MPEVTAELRALLNTASDAVVCVRGGEIIYANDAAVRAFGQLCGREAAELLPAEALAAGEAASVSCRVGAAGAQVRRAAACGMDVYFISEADAFPSGGERLRAEAADHVMLMRALARRLDGLAPSDGELPGLTAELRAATFRLWRRLLSDAVLGRAQSGGAPLNVMELDLAALCADLVSSTDYFTRQRGIEARFAGPESLPWRADRSLIEQMLLNLMVNSLQHMPGGGALLLSLRELGGRAVLTVSDTGEGIPEPEIGGLFSGYGEGLRLARAVCALHGGSLIVESRPGRGTSVSCTLSRLPEGRLSSPGLPEGPGGMELILAGLSPWLRAGDYDPRLLD